MNKKILVVFVALAVVAMLATYAAPVFAATKVPATFSTNKVITTGGTTNTTPSGIIHVKGAVRTANATITYGSHVYTNGSITVDLDFVVNPKKGTTTNHYHKITIVFPVQTGLPQEGTFKGVLTWTAELGSTPGSIIPSTMDSHAVLHGSGFFDGYMLFLDRDPEKGSNNWMLIP